MTKKTHSSELHAQANALRKKMNEVGKAAFAYVPPGKVEKILRGWLGRGQIDPDDARNEALLDEALALSTDLALFFPSASGTTAIDRLLRRRRPAEGEQEAFAALGKVRFHLLEMQTEEAPGILELKDVLSGQSLRLIDDSFTLLAGQSIAVRLAPLPGSEAFVRFGAVIPLDDTAFALAMDFVRKNKDGRQRLTNPFRCVEALARDVVQRWHQRIELKEPHHAQQKTFSFSRPSDFPYGPEDSEVCAFAFAWSAQEGEPSPEEVAEARTLTHIDHLIDAVSMACLAQECKLPKLAEAFSRLATLQMETQLRRVGAGVGDRGWTLDDVAVQINAQVVRGDFPPKVRNFFDMLRRQVKVAPAGKPADADLDRLIQRIQALRTKTVEQGCTEAEALAAAEKVAELLDRYGLSLSELDLRQQSCEGIGIETARRRMAPIDDCIPSVAAFFDCRIWREKMADGQLRYMFFGLPADVEAAHYLYDLIEQAFATETAQFKVSPAYQELPSGTRRSGTHSFQVGLSHGIIDKLARLRKERQAAMSQSSGRDLVPIKASVVDNELDQLGIAFKTSRRSTKRRVLADAYETGHEAGQRFEPHQGITGDKGMSDG